jgi:hypothetical protein
MGIWNNENFREEYAKRYGGYYQRNGIITGFHRKVEFIQRRAYDFRNFEELIARQNSMWLTKKDLISFYGGEIPPPISSV